MGEKKRRTVERPTKRRKAERKERRKKEREREREREKERKRGEEEKDEVIPGSKFNILCSKSTARGLAEGGNKV